MAKKDRIILKTYFKKGDRPSEGQFADLIDSGLNAIEDKATQAEIEAGTNDEKFVTPLGVSKLINTSNKDASTTVKGVAEIATLAEVENGTDSQRFVTPEGAKRAAEKHALVKKVNGKAPDSAGNIQATSIISAFLTAVQTNNTVTPAVLTDHTFVIPAEKSAKITGNLIFTSTAVTTGSAYGIRVAQGAGASGSAIGSWSIEVGVSSTAIASGLRDGDAFNVAANTNVIAEVIGTSSTSTSANNSGTLNVLIKNTATNADTTVTITFRSEVAGSTITAQIGTGAVAIIS
jgi:hypothetical protein